MNAEISRNDDQASPSDMGLGERHPLRTAVKVVAGVVLAWATMIGVACWLTGDMYMDAKLTTLGIHPGVIDLPADRVARYGFTILYLGGFHLTGTLWGWLLTILSWAISIAAFFALFAKARRVTMTGPIARLASCIGRVAQVMWVHVVERIRGITPEQAQKYNKALKMADIGNSWALAMLMPPLLATLAFLAGARQGQAEAQGIASALPHCLSSKQCRHICVGNTTITGIIAFADSDKLIVATNQAIRVLPQTHPRFIGYAVTTPPQNCPTPVSPAF